MSDYDILDCGERPSPFGTVVLLRIHRRDMVKMSWAELAGVVQGLYPGRWAMQMIPPKALTMDQANKYHVFVFPGSFQPGCLDLGA